MAQQHTMTSDSQTTPDIEQTHQACQAQLERYATEVAQLKQKLTYATADLDTVRRRSHEERSRAVARAELAVLRDVLTIVDNFERAQESASLPEGVDLVFKGCKSILSRHGISEIAQMQTFDPHLHEAIGHEPREGVESGTILAVAQKGYERNGEVIRPAHVVVAA